MHTAIASLSFFRLMKLECRRSRKINRKTEKPQKPNVTTSATIVGFSFSACSTISTAKRTSAPGKCLQRTEAEKLRRKMRARELGIENPEAIAENAHGMRRRMNCSSCSWPSFQHFVQMNSNILHLSAREKVKSTWSSLGKIARRLMAF